MVFGHLGELAIILTIALIVFGPEKLPEVAASAGRMVRDVREAMNVAMNPEDTEVPDDFQTYYYESLQRAGEDVPDDEDEFTLHEDPFDEWSEDADAEATDESEWDTDAETLDTDGSAWDTDTVVSETDEVGWNGEADGSAWEAGAMDMAEPGTVEGAARESDQTNAAAFGAGASPAGRERLNAEDAPAGDMGSAGIDDPAAQSETRSPGA